MYKKLLIIFLLFFNCIKGFFYQAFVLKRGNQQIILFADMHTIESEFYSANLAKIDFAQRKASMQLLSNLGNESLVLVEDMQNYEGLDEFIHFSEKQLDKYDAQLGNSEHYNSGTLGNLSFDCKLMDPDFPIINIEHRFFDLCLQLLEIERDNEIDLKIDDIGEFKFKILENARNNYLSARNRMQSLMTVSSSRNRYSKDLSILTSSFPKLMGDDESTYIILLAQKEDAKTKGLDSVDIPHSKEHDYQVLESKVIDLIIHNQQKTKIFAFLGGGHVESILPILRKMNFNLIYKYGNDKYTCLDRWSTFNDMHLDELINASLEHVNQVAFPNLTAVPSEFFELCKMPKLKARIFNGIRKVKPIKNSNNSK